MREIEIENSAENLNSDSKIPVSSLKITKCFPDGTKKEETLLSINEHNFEIIINGKKIFSLVCTASNLIELAAGRLLTGGLISCKNDISDIRLCETKRRAFVTLKSDLVFEKDNSSEPSCCTQNRQFFRNADEKNLPVMKKALVKPEEVFALAEYFSKGSVLHTHTSGTHSAILMYKGKPVFTSEDIGRHNALDKAVGFMLLNDILPSEAMLFTSGRVPVDMAEKVIRAEIPVLVSKSVPTVQSVKLAEEHGLTLIFRAWKDSFEVAGKNL